VRADLMESVRRLLANTSRLAQVERRSSRNGRCQDTSVAGYAVRAASRRSPTTTPTIRATPAPSGTRTLPGHGGAVRSPKAYDKPDLGLAGRERWIQRVRAVRRHRLRRHAGLSPTGWRRPLGLGTKKSAMKPSYNRPNKCSSPGTGVA